MATDVRTNATDGVAVLTLSNPERRNALSLAHMRELIAAFAPRGRVEFVGEFAEPDAARRHEQQAREEPDAEGRDQLEHAAYEDLFRR